MSLPKTLLVEQLRGAIRLVHPLFENAILRKPFAPRSRWAIAQWYGSRGWKDITCVVWSIQGVPLPGWPGWKGFPGIPTTIKTMGVNITTIVYLRVLIIQIGSTIILMVVEA